MPELNPVTKQRLWYIVVFLLLDGIVSMYIGWSSPASGFALPAVIFSFLNFVAAITIGCLIYAFRPGQENLKSARSRE